MKRIIFVVFAVFLVLPSFLSSIDANAASRRAVKVTSKNRTQFRRIKSLNRFNIKGICRVRTSSYQLGKIRSRVFTPFSGSYVSSMNHSRRGFVAAYKGAKKECRNLYRSVSARNPSGSYPAPTWNGHAPWDGVPIPNLDDWEAHMTAFGAIHCASLGSSRTDPDTKLLGTYYDAEWIFYRIRDYTGDESWNNCAALAESVYRDGYVRPADSVVPGYWNFTRGLVEDYLRTGDPVSRATAVQLSQFASYNPDWTPLDWTQDAALSREVAYAILAYLNAEDVGEARRPRVDALENQALGHIDQWVVSQSAAYVRPFMVGLTSQALIAYDDRVGDPRIVPALAAAMDWLWDHTWIPDQECFMYTDRSTSSGGMEPAPDLNMLVAPAFAWLYHQTGETRFRDRGDQIFAGGVKHSYIQNAKQFNQSYRWSFDFIRWRASAPLG